VKGGWGRPVRFAGRRRREPPQTRFLRGGGIGRRGKDEGGMGQFLTGRNYISKFGKTQSFAERASRRAERVGVGYPIDLTAGETKPTAEAPQRETPEGVALD